MMEGYVEKIEDSGVFDLAVDMLTSMIGSVQIMRIKASATSIAEQYSIRINDQWRICFKWAGNKAKDVEIVDYHD